MRVVNLNPNPPPRVETTNHGGNNEDHWLDFLSDPSISPSRNITSPTILQRQVALLAPPGLSIDTVLGDAATLQNQFVKSFDGCCTKGPFPPPPLAGPGPAIIGEPTAAQAPAAGISNDELVGEPDPVASPAPLAVAEQDPFPPLPPAGPGPATVGQPTAVQAPAAGISTASAGGSGQRPARKDYHGKCEAHNTSKQSCGKCLIALVASVDAPGCKEEVYEAAYQNSFEFDKCHSCVAASLGKKLSKRKAGEVMGGLAVLNVRPFPKKYDCKQKSHRVINLISSCGCEDKKGKLLEWKMCNNDSCRQQDGRAGRFFCDLCGLTISHHTSEKCAKKQRELVKPGDKDLVSRRQGLVARLDQLKAIDSRLKEHGLGSDSDDTQVSLTLSLYLSNPPRPPLPPPLPPSLWCTHANSRARLGHVQAIDACGDLVVGKACNVTELIHKKQKRERPRRLAGFSASLGTEAEKPASLMACSIASPGTELENSKPPRDGPGLESPGLGPSPKRSRISADAARWPHWLGGEAVQVAPILQTGLPAGFWPEPCPALSAGLVPELNSFCFPGLSAGTGREPDGGWASSAIIGEGGGEWGPGLFPSPPMAGPGPVTAGSLSMEELDWQEELTPLSP